MKEIHKVKKICDLDRKVETILKYQNASIDKLTEDEVRKMAHKLQVYQIKLGMQNDELRKALLKQEKSEEKYVDLYDFAPVGYLTFCPRSKIVEVNTKASEMIGRERKSLIGSAFNLFIVQEYGDIFYKHLQYIFNYKEAHKCELRLKREGGYEFWVLLESNYVKNRGDTAVCRSIMIDITEQKERKKRQE